MQNVAVMIEELSAREWERLNAQTDGEVLRQAAKVLENAIQEMDEAAGCVNEAAEALADTPEGDRIASILDEMERLLKDMRAYRRQWEVA